MVHAVNPVSIFLPVLAIVALTLLGFLRMAAARGAAVKAGQDPAFYRCYQGSPEPEPAIIAARHWGNLFEAPVLFYAGCISAYALGAVTVWTLAFAWSFAVMRVLQSAVHLTGNAPTWRGLFFSLAVFSAFALWGDLALAILARM